MHAYSVVFYFLSFQPFIDRFFSLTVAVWRDFTTRAYDLGRQLDVFIPDFSLCHHLPFCFSALHYLPVVKSTSLSVTLVFMPGTLIEFTIPARCLFDYCGCNVDFRATTAHFSQRDWSERIHHKSSSVHCLFIENRQQFIPQLKNTQYHSVDSTKEQKQTDEDRIPHFKPTGTHI